MAFTTGMLELVAPVRTARGVALKRELLVECVHLTTDRARDTGHSVSTRSSSPLPPPHTVIHSAHAQQCANMQTIQQGRKVRPWTAPECI